MSSRRRVIIVATPFLAVAAAGVSAAVLALLVTVAQPADDCAEQRATGAPGGGIVLGPPGTDQTVGATEYGGPGDPSSGATGARGDSLRLHPDTYAELGGLTWQSATAMGGLPYMTPLRVSWGAHSAIAYKRDFGFGGGPVAGLPRVIDLWWELAGRLGIPYEAGRWSGAVQVQRPPATGAGAVLALTPNPGAPLLAPTAGAPDTTACESGSGPGLGVPLTAGSVAGLRPDGLAAAPADAPDSVKEIIAAGNQIVGRPYDYGAAHGLPLSVIAPAYDCSSSVEHLLYGARLLPVTYGAASSELESFGGSGPGRWVTLYANPDHVFMYVAGLRWDTWNAAGSGDGSDGIGWHPLVRDANGFVPRHPYGL